MTSKPSRALAAALFLSAFIWSAEAQDSKRFDIGGSASADIKLAGERLRDIGKTPEDAELAVRLLMRAAKSGDSVAIMDLGLLFLKGDDGIAPDQKLARQYLTQSIDAGNEDAAFALGMAAIRGKGIDQDAPLGLKLLTQKGVQTASNGPRAAYEVGLMYLSGAAGVDANPAKARRYLDIAVAGGIEDASLRLGRALLTGRGLEKDETGGAALLEKLGSEGSPEASATAIAELGTAYLAGEGVAPDPERARSYLMAAMNSGDKRAGLRLGQALIEGKGVAPDPATGLEILNRLTAGGDAIAIQSCLELGQVFLTGTDGIHADPFKARFYLERAADQGSAEATFRLALAVLSGNGLQRNEAVGVQAMSSIAEQDSFFGRRAAFELGRHYLDRDPNPELARKYLELASLGGHAAATLRLGTELLYGKVWPADPLLAMTLLTPLADVPGLTKASTNFELGRFLLNGGGTLKADGKKARRYLETAAAEGGDDALIELGIAAMYGKIGPKDGMLALSYFEKAKEAGNKGATIQTARVYITGAPGVKRDVDRGLAILVESVTAGDVPALRELISEYRGDGRSGRIDHDAALKYLTAFKAVGMPDDVRFEESLLAIASKAKNYEDVAAIFATVPVALQGRAIRRVYALDARAAIFIVQGRLKTANLYSGEVDAIAGNGTVRAIARACGTPGRGACAVRPISATTMEFIVNNFPKGKPHSESGHP